MIIKTQSGCVDWVFYDIINTKEYYYYGKRKETYTQSTNDVGQA